MHKPDAEIRCRAGDALSADRLNLGKTLPPALMHDTNEVDHGVGIAHGGPDRAGMAQIGLHAMNLPDPSEWLQMANEVWPAHGHADAITPLAQDADELTADKPGTAEDGHEPIHVGLSKHADFCRLAGSLRRQYRIGGGLLRAVAGAI